MRTRLVAVLMALVAKAAFATVYIYPTFSDPVVAGDSILVTNPDSTLFECVGPSGDLRWTRRVDKLISFGRLDDEHFYIQEDRKVLRVDASSGAQSLLTTLPKDEAITISREEGLAFSTASNPERRMFVMRDPLTLRQLWRDDRVESIAAAGDDRVYVVTATRHVSDDHSFTISGSTLLALDRKHGREVWSHTLHDSQTLQVRAALAGSHLVIAEGVMPASITVLDAASGAVEKDLSSTMLGAEGIFDLHKQSDDEALILQAMRGSNQPDLLSVVSIPSLEVKRSISLPAQENLFFHIDGDIVVTSGIYSVAAFDLRSGKKLWEIGDQLLISRPENGVMYASRSAADDDVAILERVDVRTGAEVTIHSERLPEAMTRNAREKARVEWDKAQAEREAETRRARAAEEERERVPIGSEICLRYDQTGALDIREYWFLHRDGTAEFLDLDPNFSFARAIGVWQKDHSGVYEIRGTPLVRDVETKDLAITVGVKANLPLLSDLRDVVEAVAQTHAAGSISNTDFDALRATAPGCPPEARSFCTASGDRTISVHRKALAVEPKPVTTEQLDELVAAIGLYQKALPDADRLRFRLRSYRSYTYADWIDSRSYWPAEDVEADIDQAIELKRAAVADQEPGLFRLAPCSDVALIFKTYANAVVWNAK